MADFIKVTVYKGGEIYLSKYGISYISKLGGYDYTVIKLTGENNEETNSIKVEETPEKIIRLFKE